jgi:hypothetical protein
MNQEIKQQWLAALRSGEYRQARQALRHGDTFCCLGVLCDLHAKATGGEWRISNWNEGMYDNDISGLPHTVRAWAGLDRRYPLIDETDITYFNDGAEGDDEDFATIVPHSFAQIADLIEAHL